MSGEQESGLPLERLDEIARDVFADMRLNGGAPIAVIGSGLSVPYGGVRWETLTRWALREAARQLRAALAAAPSARKRLPLQQAQRAVTAFQSGSMSDATELYLAMQVASDGIARARASHNDPDARGPAFKPFMARVASDTGYRLWLELCDLIDPKGKHRETLTERTGAAWLQVVGAFYSWKTLDALCGECPRESTRGTLGSILKRTRAALEKAGHAGDFLPPDMRGLLPFVLAWLEGAGVRIDAVRLFDLACTKLPEHQILLRPVADPIRQLYHRLGVRRFITLNYDLEIENTLMIDDLQAVMGCGYGLVAALRDGKVDREYQSVFGERRYTGGITRRYSDGMAASSDVYQAIASARLFEFALNSPDYRLQILHQHGRADFGDEQLGAEIIEKMVLTDEDLNRLYRRNRRDATTLEQALDVTLTGNPILFVGIGLQEPEITRALRELVSQQRASIDDPAFAIVTFTDRAATDATPDGLAAWRRQLGLLQQYGVHMLDAGHPRHGGPGLSAKDAALKLLLAKLKPGRGGILPRREELAGLLGRCVAAQVAKGLPGDEELFGEFVAAVGSGALRLSAANVRWLAGWLGQLRANQLSQALLQEIDRLHAGTLTRGARTTWRKPDEGRDEKKRDLLKSFPREHEMMSYLAQSRRHVAAVPPVNFEGFKDVIARLRVRVARPGVTLLEGGDFAGKGTVLRSLTESFPPQRPWCHLNCNMSLELDSAVFQLLRAVRGESLTDKDTYNRLNNLLAALAGPSPARPRPLVILSGLERLLDARSRPLAPELELMVRMLVHPELGARKLHVLIAGTKAAIDWVRSIHDGPLPDPVLMPAAPTGLLLKLENFVGASRAAPDLKARARLWRQYATAPFVPNGARVPASQYLIGLVLEHWHDIATDISRAEAELDRQVLQNLAYVGQPVEMSVLRHMPDVAAAARQPRSPATLTPIAQAIDAACDRLTEAGLAMYIASNPGEEPGRTPARLALPRAVLAELRERFGVRSGEEQLSNSFTLTLAASMPHDLVIPDEDVTSALARTVGHLRAAWKDKELSGSPARFLPTLRRAAASLLSGGKDRQLAGLHMQTAGLIGRINRVERLARMAGTPSQANLRAAAAIVRGIFNAATLVSLDPSLARWQPAEGAGDYEAHRKRIEKLLSRARLVNSLRREIAAELWAIRREFRTLGGRPAGFPSVNTLIGPQSRPMAGSLYSGELVWLLNEAGVIAQLQGRLKIAARHYREALFALDRYKGPGTGMSRRRLMINQAFLKIERGRIAEARADLNGLDAAFVSSGMRAYGTEFVARHEVKICKPLIDGYLGLVDALEGHFVSARHHYDAAIRALHKAEQQRALALFYWRRGTLELYLGHEDAAHRDLNLAIAEAENGQQLDVVWRARLKATELPAERGGGMALTIFREAQVYATAMKLPRLEAMVLHREAEWRMERDDLPAAAALATRAMCYATANGMTLMRIRLRTLMGEIMLRQGDPSGDFLLQRALSHANRIGYQLQLNQARKALLRVQAMRKG